MENFDFIKKYSTILADPPWRFDDRHMKCAPEGHSTFHYQTMCIDEIKQMPINDISETNSHLYLWVPNTLIQEGLDVMKAWGYQYKSNIVWVKTYKSGKKVVGLGRYFRNATELILFGVKGKLKIQNYSQINVIEAVKREHSRKPDEQYELIERCSPGAYLELFARNKRDGWDSWGNEVGKYS